MNDLLFYALLIVLLYYFFYYLPSQKKLNAHLPLPQNKGTQTEPLTDDYQTEIEELKTQNQSLETELKNNSQDYQQRIKDHQTQITKLQSEIRELAKRPLKPTNSKGTQTDDQELTNTLDTLIKDIQELNNSLN